MRTYNEWKSLQKENYQVLTTEDGVLDHQIDQLINKFEGLLYGIADEEKVPLVEKFIRTVEARMIKK